ncbi:MAG: DUF58 domain-containing protein [Frankiaceae bacterium]|nr:DUF58 domain-containing protein [Frankiaceae bacterium]
MSGVPLAPEASARRLRLDVARRLDGMLAGDHLGFLFGPGTEAAEARLYGPGDDVRRIDWSVTARTQQTHVRDAVAERELETTLLVDLTASMSFGTVRCEKRDIALAVAAAVMHLAAGPGDRVGAVVLGSEGMRRLPPRGGRDASLALLHRLLTEPRAEGAGPDLAAGLAAVLNPPRRRGLVVVLSDLLSPPGVEPPWARPLRMLATRHDVIVAEVLDPRELTLPDVGVLRLVDPETGRHLEVQTRSKALRERYAAAAAQRRSGHAAAVRRAGAGHVVLRTDRDWLVDLATFLATRRRLRAAGRAAVVR